MRSTTFCGVMMSLLCGWVLCAASLGQAQELPQFDPPTKDHEWLKQLEGEWDMEMSMTLPDGTSMNDKGTEAVKTMGGFWSVSESAAGVLTLGYDTKKKQYVGTFICGMNDYMWKYEGQLDKTGKILTLETEGPNMIVPGKLAKYKDIITVTDKDTKVLESVILGPDDKWTSIMKATYTRKKESKK